MCGVAGILSLDGSPVDRGAVERMISALAHRGPDGIRVQVDGIVGLGHSRLSILDPTPAGAQPMVRAPCVIVHNGEVYNYLELAADLRGRGHHIDTGTDTEVILAAYREWGLEAVARFNGDYAFALWDAERRRLVLARDRMGVKPLYLRRTGPCLAFASEVPALLAGSPIYPGDGWSPEPHLGVVRDFLARGSIDHSTATFIRGIEALRPGHLLVVENGSARLIRYWGPPPLADDNRPAVRGTDRQRDLRLVDEFRALFDSSVRLRLRSDVPVGTCLSGGLDSSSIVVTVAASVGARQSAVVEHEQVPRLAFHARFPDEGIDESAYAELVARSSGVQLIYQTPSASPLLSAVLPILRAQGEPYGGASIHAQYAIMAAAHQEGVTVLLDGQGADELLGGYVHFLGVRTAGLVASLHPFEAARELRSQVHCGPLSVSAAIAYAIRGGLPPSVIEAVRGASHGRYGIRLASSLGHEAPLVETRDEPGTFLARRLWRALSQDLPPLLRYEDRNSMAFGIEARVPFLDVRLVEMAVRLPDRLRIDRGVTKMVLRHAMMGRLPEAIAKRRDKLGFAAPQHAWLAGGLTELAALLRGGQIVARGWVNRTEIERILSTGLAGRRQTEQLWRLFITEAWLRTQWPDAGAAVGSALRGLDI